MTRVLLATICFYLLPLSLTAQEVQPIAVDTTKPVLPPVDKFYVANNIDGLIFSTATIDNPSVQDKFGTIRFSAFFHIGFTFNFNLSRHFGIYTGIGVKNVGFIEKLDGQVTKRRTYNIGVPLGIRVGNMARSGKYFFFGGGADVPVNYREKQFSIRDQKTARFNEWFSDRTPMIMPYVFAGVGMTQGFSVKFQYYLNNYLNPDFIQSTTYKPYAGYDVHLILMSLGYTTKISGHRKKAQVL